MRTLILIFLSLFLTLIAKSQNIDSALIKFHSINTYEKVYVHFDNTKYTPGQTIWYKAYLMNGFQPSLLSKNLYIDWYDDNGNLLNSTVTPIITSFSNGNFKVPENYKGSNIHAVAYTKWMRNFDSVYFFNQNLQIVSNIVAKANKDIVVTESSIQLLPESGSLIANKINEAIGEKLVEKGSIFLSKPIKETGIYEAKLALHSELAISVKLVVSRSESEAHAMLNPKKPAKAKEESENSHDESLSVLIVHKDMVE